MRARDTVNLSLPILPLATAGQRYSCHGCGNCCRDFTIQLRADDVARLREQSWQSRLGIDPIVGFRGGQYLRQRSDGACVFLLDDGRCRVHAEFGFEAKPIACQMFPYMLSPTETTSQMGVSFACQSVVENKGKLLNQQVAEALKIVTRGIPEVLRPARNAQISRGKSGQSEQLLCLAQRLKSWMERDAPLDQRIDGVAWIAQTLAVANFRKLDGSRIEAIIHLLFDSLCDELPHHPIAVATDRQNALLQGAIFARTEDPKPLAQGAPGRLLSILSQLRRSRAWRRGHTTSLIPQIGSDWTAKTTFGEVAAVDRLRASPESTSCDELISRWMRASIEGGRIWGSGYYGWNAVDGLAAFVLSTTAVGWLARLHAAGSGVKTPRLVDVQAAVGRIDRTAGRAVWLGGFSERMRLSYLTRDHGLRRLAAAQF